METEKPLELYVHIPFCVKKCAYCDFLSFPVGEDGQGKSGQIDSRMQDGQEKSGQTDSRMQNRQGKSGQADSCMQDSPCMKNGRWGSIGKEEREAYIPALIREIHARGRTCTGYTVQTIFVGGGTPSILSMEETAALFAAMRNSFRIAADAEITMEVNPGTVTEEKLKFLKSLGINRLSIGAQSMDNRELKALGRIHTAEDFAGTWEAGRRVGFANMNLDLMMALPGQTTESWEKTLRKAAALSPEHISAYSLMIEEGTAFYELYGDKVDTESCRTEKKGDPNAMSAGVSAFAPASARMSLSVPVSASTPATASTSATASTPATVSASSPAAASTPATVSASAHAVLSDSALVPEILPLPDEDTEREMYVRTQEILAEYGYRRYEISNYAKDGYACRHNIGYWRRKEYLGLGLGAASLMDECRFKNTDNMKKYLAAFADAQAAKPAEECAQRQDEGDAVKPAEEHAQQQAEGRAVSRPEGQQAVKQANVQPAQPAEQHAAMAAAQKAPQPAPELCRPGWEMPQTEEFEVLSKEEQIAEYMFLGLRMMNGISVTKFGETFGRPLDEVYGAQIRKLCAQELLTEEEDRLRLTERGCDLCNLVCCEFVV